jgi:hypothetical protein
MSNQQVERVIRKMRVNMDDYEAKGQLVKCQKVLTRCRARMAPVWEARQHDVQERIMRNYMM